MIDSFPKVSNIAELILERQKSIGLNFADFSTILLPQGVNEFWLMGGEL